ncbi:MAG: DUF4360 domain-containing protein [Deltaproteobacteria bacterium]|nr:DUF4360 domain-containing protein [Deltaproteobacteria bacterium]
MPWRSHSASLASVFHLLFMTSATLAQAPDPNTVYIDSVVALGSGCPRGSTAHSLSPDAHAFTLIFDQYIAVAEPGLAADERSKNCTIAIDLRFPSGWSYSIFGVDFRGFANLEDEMTGTLSATYRVGNHGTRASLDAKFYGPMNQNYLAQDRLDLNGVSWSPCGTTQALNIDTQIKVNGVASGMLTVDSIDGQVEHVYGIQWRRCGARDRSLDGGWFSPQGQPVSIKQNAQNLHLTNRLGLTSEGHLVTPMTVNALDWHLIGSVLDGGGRIQWSNGVAWTREQPLFYDLSGVWYNPAREAVAIQQSGGHLLLTNRYGLLSEGEFSTANTVNALTWQITGQIRNGGNQIQWSNGTTWYRQPPNLPRFQGTWYNAAGDVTSIRQNGRQLSLTNRLGDISSGSLIWIGEFVIQAHEWGITGQVIDSGKRINWSNGVVWFSNRPIEIYWSKS